MKILCFNPLMSRIERRYSRYCLISTSYLTGLFDISILLNSYLTELD